MADGCFLIFGGGLEDDDLRMLGSEMADGDPVADVEDVISVLLCSLNLPPKDVRAGGAAPLLSTVSGLLVLDLEGLKK